METPSTRHTLRGAGVLAALTLALSTCAAATVVPDAGCVANTTFRGRLTGDRMEGTFETRLATGVIAEGRWQASRRAVR